MFLRLCPIRHYSVLSLTIRSRVPGQKRRRRLKQICALLYVLPLAVCLSACDSPKLQLSPRLFITGETLFLAGDGSLPKSLAELEDLQGSQSGYKCKVNGFLGAYASITDCQAVLFNGNTFYDDGELQRAVAEAHPKQTMHVGTWPRYGIAVMTLVLLVGAALLLRSELTRRKAHSNNDPA